LQILMSNIPFVNIYFRQIFEKIIFLPDIGEVRAALYTVLLAPTVEEEARLCGPIL
jgi:hypothetical protein